MYATRSLSFTHKKHVQLHVLKGKLLANNRDLETVVSGYGSGGEIKGKASGSVFGGSGSLHGTMKGKIDPVRIRSETFVHEELFLLDEATGKEHSFNFTDWQISCRPDNQMIVVWWNDEQRNSVVYVENQSLNQNYQAPAKLSYPNLMGSFEGFLIVLVRLLLMIAILAVVWFGADWLFLPTDSFTKIIYYVVKFFVMCGVLGFAWAVISDMDLAKYCAPTAQRDTAKFEDEISNLIDEVRA